MDSQKPPHALLPQHLQSSAIDLWSQAGSHHWISVSGNSMLPLIHDRDQLLVSHGRSSNCRGTIVVFQYEDVLIAHRIISLRSNLGRQTLVTKGDHVTVFDPPLTNDQIVGTVLGIQREGRYISLDTSFWRAFGKYIAFSTIASSRAYNSLRKIKRSFLGTQPSPIIGFVYRVMRRLFEITLGLVFALAARWK